MTRDEAADILDDIEIEFMPQKQIDALDLAVKVLTERKTKQYGDYEDYNAEDPRTLEDALIKLGGTLACAAWEFGPPAKLEWIIRSDGFYSVSTIGWKASFYER